MWSRKEIKARGREAFQKNYLRSVLVAILLTALAGGSGASAGNSVSSATEGTNPFAAMDPQVLMAIGMAVLGVLGIVFVISFLLQIFLFNPLKIGCHAFFSDNIQQDGAAGLDALMTGFRNYGRSFVTMLLRSIFLALWSMLFVIPGLIKAYSYRMVPYIIRDNPELSPTEVITRSRKMMNGHKWATFVMDLSFLGWILLGAITFGLGLIFWTDPYLASTEAALYQELKKEYRD
jgi:uncharacterized membrane protein